jgi:hypothetical protein
MASVILLIGKVSRPIETYHRISVSAPGHMMVIDSTVAHVGVTSQLEAIWGGTSDGPRLLRTRDYLAQVATPTREAFAGPRGLSGRTAGGCERGLDPRAPQRGHVPLNEETRGMVDEGFVAAMKPGACFVNTARGGIVRDLEVFHAPLRNGRLAGVALDVLPEEPPGDSPLLRAWREREPWLDGRLLINPHAAFFSESAYQEMRRKAATNALRILKGDEPYNVLQHHSECAHRRC